MTHRANFIIPKEEWEKFKKLVKQEDKEISYSRTIREMVRKYIKENEE